MKMRGTIAMGIVAISVVGGFWSLNKLCDFLLQASYVSFSFDTYLSHTQQEKIKFAVTHGGLLNPTTIAALIKEKCVAVDTVSIVRQPNNSWHISIASAPPFLTINTDWILSKSGSMVPRSHYETSCVSSLAGITMKTSNSAVPIISSALKQWLAQLDAAFFENYFITWNHDYDIVLTEKKNPVFALITTATHRISSETLALCDRIKQDILQRPLPTHRKIVKADIRFDKQIVLSGDLGGNKHG